MFLGGPGTVSLAVLDFAQRHARGSALRALVWYALACVHSSALAQATEAPLELVWDAPNGCPSKAEVLERIRRHVPAFDASPVQVQAEARVTRSGSRYRLALSLRSGNTVARKNLDSGSCDTAMNAAALLVALAFDPNSAVDREITATDEQNAATRAEAGRVVSHPETDVPPESRAQAVQQADPKRAATTRAPPLTKPELRLARSAPVDLRYAAGAALAIDLGMLPRSPAWGLQPWVALSIDWLRVAASFTWWVSGQAASDYRGAVLEGRAVAGDLSLGVELARPQLSLVPQAVAELARLTVSTVGISEPGSAAATWAAVGAGLHGEYRISGDLRITLETCALVPFRRARWLVRASEGDVVVLSASAATLRFSAGMAYVFP